jgi:hypothetical protein
MIGRRCHYCGQRLPEVRLHSRETLKAHVYQINELIEDEGYRIANGGSGYRLVSR